MPTVSCPKCMSNFEATASDLKQSTCPACQAAEQGSRDTLPLPGQSETLPVPDPETPNLAAVATLPLPDPTDPPAVSTAPQFLVGRFVIEAKLGEGAFGVVYKAHDPQLDRKVALKVAKPGALDTPEKVRRFLREAKAAANLRHPNIVPLYESGRDGERYFIASAYIEGRTLATELDRAGGRFESPRAAEIVRKLAEALSYAHRHGIVHRDVKPANVMVDSLGDPLLMDFGLAARADDAKLSQDGTAMGTPAYMAPEQAVGNGQPASDQYSLGCVLYELLTGQTPFSGTPGHQIFLHQSEPAPSPRSLAETIPRDLDTVVLKCLAKSTAERYASCADFAEDLRRWIAGEPVTARRIGPVERLTKWTRRNPALASSMAVALVAMVTGTAISLWQADVAAGEAENAVKAAKGEADQRKVADDEAVKARDEAKRADGEAAKARKEAKESRRLLDLARLRTAQSAWEKNQPDAARQTLELIAPENRCFVWGLLHKRFYGLFRLIGHTEWVACVCFSPDGSRVATGSGDPGRPGDIRVWDARTGQLLHVLRGHTGAVRSVCFSPDGTRLASGSAAGIGEPCETRVWDARTGGLLFELPEPSGGVRTVCFSPDGSQLATGSEDQKNRRGKARVWDTRTGKALDEIPGHQGDVTCLQFSPDGSRIAIASGFGPAYIWDTVSRKRDAEFKPNDAIHGLSFSPDGTRLATASGQSPFEGDSSARVWDIKTGQMLVELRSHRGTTSVPSFSPDGTRIATGGEFDNTARVWDVKTGKQLVEIKGHTDTVSGVAFSPDGLQLVTASHDRTAAIWDARTGEAVRYGPRLANPSSTPGVTTRIRPDWSDITTAGDTLLPRVARLPRVKNATEIGPVASCSPDGSRIASRTTTGAIVWDARTLQVLHEFVVRDATPGACFSPDGSRLAHGSFANNPIVWNLQTGNGEFELHGHTHGVNAVCFSPDGSRIVTGSIDKTVRVWDARTGQTLLELQGHTKDVTCVCFSPDGSRIASGSTDQTCRIWDATTGEPLLVLSGFLTKYDPVTSVDFSPDGLQLATGSWDDAFRIWDGRTDANRVEFRGHTRAVQCVSCSPDGTRIATGSVDKTVRIWDAGTGESLFELRGHKNPVQSVAFEADGRFIVSQALNSLRVWDARTGQALGEFEGLYQAYAASPDGSRIATTTQVGKTELWDPQTGRRLFVINETEFRNTCLGFSPDGTRLAAGSGTFETGQIQIWDAHDGRRIVEFSDETSPKPRGTVRSVSFTANGSRLITRSESETFLWDAKTGRRVLNEQPPPNRNQGESPDGRYRYIPDGKLVARISRTVPESERRARFVQTRPTPDFHSREAERFAKENNPFAAAVHRSLEQRASGQRMIDAGDFRSGFWQFVAAEIVRPKPRSWPRIRKRNKSGASRPTEQSR